MPEGPSIVIAREEISIFEGKKILKASGNAKIDFSIFKNQSVNAIKTWGKHLLICFPSFSVSIHFLMFGTYRINEPRKAVPRLSLSFKKGTLYFYACSVKIIEKPLDEVYDWSADIMSDSWSARKAARKLAACSDVLVCDALMDQEIFSGLGNIIKNEVLFRIKVHPKTKLGNLPVPKRASMIREVRKYSFQFLKWKKDFTLKKHWQIYTKKICPRDKSAVVKEYMGQGKRRTFYCNSCQTLYKPAAKYR